MKPRRISHHRGDERNHGSREGRQTAPELLGERSLVCAPTMALKPRSTAITQSRKALGTSNVARKDAARHVSPWASLLLCPLTAEGEREIAQNIVGFFGVLSKWAVAERGESGDRFETRNS